MDLTGILHTIILALGSLLAAALTAAATNFARKNGVELSAAQHDLLVKIVGEGINFAEEKVASEQAAPAQKHQLAVGYVQAAVPGLSHQEASDAIHAALPDSGQGATAASDSQVVPFDPTKSTPKT